MSRLGDYLRGRSKLPKGAEAVTEVGVLAAEPLRDGRFAAAYPERLDVVDPADPEARVSWLWTDMVSGEFDGETLNFTILGIADGGELVTLELTEDVERTFPLIVSDRIEDSIVYTETATLGEVSFLRVFVRRALDGSYFMQSLIYGPTPNQTPEQLGAILSELEASAWEATGLER